MPPMFEKGHMLNTRNLAKAFLHVFLLFSALSFSGHSLSNDVQRKVPAQTEAKISITQQKGRTVAWQSFSKATSPISVNHVQFSSNLKVLASQVRTELALFGDVPHDKPAKALRMYYASRISIPSSAIHPRG